MTGPLTPGDREITHHDLQPDIELIRAYGDLHADEWTDVLFENEPTIRVVALFAKNVQFHERALRAVVGHPDRLVVRSAAYSSVHLEALRSEVRELARQDPGRFKSFGVGRGRLSVWVAANQEHLAAELKSKFGEAVELKVGNFGYPMVTDGPLDERPKTSPSPAIPRVTSLDATLEGEIEIVVGGRWHGPLHLRNLRDESIVLLTNGGLMARVLDLTTGDVVGGFVGAQAVALVRFTIPPHETITVPISIHTTSFRRTLGYMVPPGGWAIDAFVEIDGEGRFRTSSVPITIVEIETLPS